MNSTNNSNNSGNIPMITSTSPQPQVTFASAPVSPHTGNGRKIINEKKKKRGGRTAKQRKEMEAL